MKATAAGVSALASVQAAPATGKPTRFQIACMTLPYSSFPLERALQGIAASGYKYVAWGTRHRTKGGQEMPLLDINAPQVEARKLADRCRDLGLTPVMMFSTIYVAADGALDGHKKRIAQAEAAGIGQVLTFGHTEGGSYPVWIRNLRELGPIARSAGVILVIKQHGGETGTGKDCARIVREVGDQGVWVNYDAGNVMDYLDADPIKDIQECVTYIRSFCIKDHRNFPTDVDCGPGFGEIDHYRLLAPVSFTGLAMPLACENISAPVVPRPQAPEGVDQLARRAREFLEAVIAGLQISGQSSGGRT
ncbi:MAG: sugar phosphate isomerase/epimerase family protein [Acidobacteriota bacterium]